MAMSVDSTGSNDSLLQSPPDDVQQQDASQSSQDQQPTQDQPATGQQSSTDQQPATGQQSSTNQQPTTGQRPTAEPPAVPSGSITKEEAQKLISHYETGSDHPSEEGNAQALANLQANGLRGEPDDAVKYEGQQILTQQQIGALPPQLHDFYEGMQAKAVNSYESSGSADERQKIAQMTNSTLTGPVTEAYRQTMDDPLQRVQQEFNTPFGSQYLGSEGQQQGGRLRELGRQFNAAETTQERENLFGQAAGVRHTLESQIGGQIGQANTQMNQQWAQTDRELHSALDGARNGQFALQGTRDDTSSFTRLNDFVSNGLTSARNAQEFGYLMQRHPEDFKDLGTWYDDVAGKTDEAHTKIQDSPFQRTPNLPAAPLDLTKISGDDLHMGNYGPELLNRYQQAGHDIANDAQMFHAAMTGGPIRDEYLDAHTPPKPLWQQQTEDVLGRFFVGLVPGVNLATNYIVPGNSLSPEARLGIDFMSGVTGGMLGAAHLPAMGEFGGLAESGEGAELDETTEAGASGHPPVPIGDAPTGENRPSLPGGSALPASSWPTAYAMDRLPTRYAPSPENPNVMTDIENGGNQQFIIRDNQAYPVRVNGGQVSIFDARHPERPSFGVAGGGDGDWRIQGRLQGGGSDPTPPPMPVNPAQANVQPPPVGFAGGAQQPNQNNLLALGAPAPNNPNMNLGQWLQQGGGNPWQPPQPQPPNPPGMG